MKFLNELDIVIVIIKAFQPWKGEMSTGSDPHTRFDCSEFLQ